MVQMQSYRLVAAGFLWTAIVCTNLSDVQAKVPLKPISWSQNVPYYMDTYKPLGDRPESNPPGTIALCASDGRGCLSFPDFELGPLEEIGSDRQKWRYSRKGLIEFQTKDDDSSKQCLGPQLSEGSLGKEPLVSGSHYMLKLGECPSKNDNDPHMRYLIQRNGLVRSLSPVVDVSTGADISLSNPYCLSILADTTSKSVGLKPCNENDPNQSFIAFGSTESFLLFLEDGVASTSTLRLAYHLGSSHDSSISKVTNKKGVYNPRIVITYANDVAAKNEKLLFKSEPVLYYDDDNTVFFGDVLAIDSKLPSSGAAYFATFDNKLESEAAPAEAALYFEIPSLAKDSDANDNKDKNEVINVTSDTNDIHLTWRDKNLRLTIAIVVTGCVWAGLMAVCISFVFKRGASCAGKDASTEMDSSTRKTPTNLDVNYEDPPIEIVQGSFENADDSDDFQDEFV